MSKFAVVFAILFVAVFAQGPVDPVAGYKAQIIGALNDRVLTLPVEQQAAATDIVTKAAAEINKCEETYKNSPVKVGPARGQFYQCSSLHYSNAHAAISALSSAPVA